MRKPSKLKFKRLSPRQAGFLHPDSLVQARTRLGWSTHQAGEFLWVSARTVRNWEAGRARIPYAALRLLRLHAGCVVSAAGWEGWRFCSDGILYSPTGQQFRATDLSYLSLVFAQARAWKRSWALGLQARLQGESHGGSAATDRANCPVF